jgi:hypothetical protein
MKLFNVIIIHDVYCVAENQDNAKLAIKAWILAGGAPTSEAALEAREAQNLRDSWKNQRPFVGDDVSDSDFKSLKGLSTQQVFERIYINR